MREFFRGWRRKAGCVALVMACLFVGAWMRGLFVDDSFRVCVGSEVFLFGSTRSGPYLLWLRENDASLVPIPFWMSRVRGDSGPPDLDQFSIESWDLAWCGFRYMDAEPGFLAIIPWYSFILPLTLLSAYLILWKPRSKVKGEPNA